MSAPVMVITGTRKGIGRFLVDYYLERGWQVVGCSRAEAEEMPAGYRHFCLDVADERAVQKMIRTVVKEFGGVDAMLNNAGIASMNHLLLTPLATVQNIFATNVFGTFNFCREAAKAMLPRKRGRIVNFATVATPLRLEGEAAYAASKAAVESLTRVMAKEVAAYGITVNAVGPTPVKTDLIKGVSDDKMAALINTQAIKRHGTFEDVANAVDFFLRDESDFITGQVLYLGGVT
jgi:3-oxoacyl-[acyl-carrier protein] reductase